jgi:hypothetical protein
MWRYDIDFHSHGCFSCAQTSFCWAYFCMWGWGHIPFIGLYAPSLKLLNKFWQNWELANLILVSSIQYAVLWMKLKSNSTIFHPGIYAAGLEKLPTINISHQLCYDTLTAGWPWCARNKTNMKIGKQQQSTCRMANLHNVYCIEVQIISPPCSVFTQELNSSLISHSTKLGRKKVTTIKIVLFPEPLLCPLQTCTWPFTPTGKPSYGVSNINLYQSIFERKGHLYYNMQFLNSYCHTKRVFARGSWGLLI